jgi:hypothetical protein
VLVSGVGLMLGCRTPAAPSRLSATDPRPGRLLAALGETAEQRRALRGRARVAIEAPDLKLRRPQRLALARPGRLRVEVLGLFGQLAAVLVARDARYQLYEAGRAQLQEGTLSPSLLWRVARVDLDLEEAVNLLLGTPRPVPGLAVSGAWRGADGRLGFVRVDARGRVRERYVFDAQGRLAEAERLDVRGARIWWAGFADYRPVLHADGSPGEFAFRLSLDFPRVDGRAKLDFQQVDLVADLPDELFILELPGGAAGPSEAAAP